jgi:hypothetical protein
MRAKPKNDLNCHEFMDGFESRRERSEWSIPVDCSKSVPRAMVNLPAQTPYANSLTGQRNGVAVASSVRQTLEAVDDSRGIIGQCISELMRDARHTKFTACGGTLVHTSCV